MRAIIAVLLFMFLTNCASTEMVVKKDGSIEWRSRTFLKDIKDAEVQWGTFHAVLGSSVGNDTVIPSALEAGAAMTGQVWLKGGPLYDMTGQPRSATAAEMAAQFEALQ